MTRLPVTKTLGGLFAGGLLAAGLLTAPARADDRPGAD
jgi:hypothetical protein